MQAEESKQSMREIIFGDEYIFFEGADGHPKYENIDEKWEEIIHWIEKVREKNSREEGFENSQPDVIGKELVKWAKKKDMYPMYLIIKGFWHIFRDTYLGEEHPPFFMEFVKEILANKMTEEEMWGQEEEKRKKGTLIVFDKKYLPTEEEKTEGLKVIYSPLDERNS